MPKDETKPFMCLYRPDPSASLSYDADRGDPEAQAALGRLYFEGRPARSSETETGKGFIVASFTPAVEQDLPGAVKWLRKAANRGHAEAKRILRTVLAKAEGVH